MKQKIREYYFKAPFCIYMLKVCFYYYIAVIVVLFQYVMFNKFLTLNNVHTTSTLPVYYACTFNTKGT